MDDGRIIRSSLHLNLAGPGRLILPSKLDLIEPISGAEPIATGGGPHHSSREVLYDASHPISNDRPTSQASFLADVVVTTNPTNE